MLTTAPAPPEPQDAPPLAVELDGVLARTDTLHEGLLRLLKRQPHLAPAVLGWSRRGGAFLR
ncbi:MAG: UbiA family prenyltransferase, partial [Archangium sp.]